MTISVVADALSVPPSVDVEVAVPVGSVMQSVSVWRNDSVGRVLLRTQPSAGFDSRQVTDFEAPYGRPVAYEWEASYTDPAESVESFVEDWSAYPDGWVGDTGAGSVSGGVLTWNPAVPAEPPGAMVVVERAVGFEWETITIDSLSTSPALDTALTLWVGGRRIQMLSQPELRVSVIGADVTTTIDPSVPFTLTSTGTAVVIQGSGGEAVVPFEYGPITSIQLSDVFDSAGVSVGRISATVAGPSYQVTETSAPVTLNPDKAWLVHPGKPALSFPLWEADGDRAGLKELNPITADSTTTLHYILGNEYPVATNNGPRLSDRLGMVLTLATADELAAIRGLLRDQTPLLIRFPPAWEVEFDDGFYSVGELDIARLAQMSGLSLRHVTLPLTAVESPIVTVETFGWSYAAVATELESYTAVLNTFATYADLAANVRI